MINQLNPDLYSKSVPLRARVNILKLECGLGMNYHKLITCITVTKNSRKVLIGYENGMVEVWCLLKKKLTNALHGHVGYIRTIVLSLDEKFLYSSGYDQKLLKWSLETNQQVANIRHFENLSFESAIVKVLYFIEKKKMLAVLDSCGKISLWKEESLENIGVFKNVINVASTSNQDFLVLAATDNKFVIVSLNNANNKA